MWVLLDNYDSFTYILHHYLLLAGNDCVVYRNDELSLDELISLDPERLIISPGPETPFQAGICLDVIRHFYDKIPILGVCLGHQALGIHFGATLSHAPSPVHGKTSEITHWHHSLFENIPSPFTAMRYHSLIIERLEHTGLHSIADTDNIIMAIAHEKYPCTGIQFHPESVGTDYGMQIIRNWAALHY